MQTSGPIFNFDLAIESIGSTDPDGVTLPIPHAHFKSVLTENRRGGLQMWSFMMSNEFSKKPLEDFLVLTTKVEQYARIFLWERLVGLEIKAEKEKVRKMWEL